MSKDSAHNFPGTIPGNDYEHITQPLIPQEAPQLGVDEQIANANRVVGALQAAIGRLSQQTREQTRTAGLATANASMPDITRSVILGRPITTEPTDMMLGSSIAREAPIAGLVPHDRLARALGRLLRSVAPYPDQISNVTTVVDGYDTIWRDTLGQRYDTRGNMYPEDTRTQFVRDVWEMQKKEGIIEPEDRAGHDYTIIPTSRYIGKTDQPGGITHDLRQSEWGKVGSHASGATIFRPGPELQRLYPSSRGTDAIWLTDQFGLETSATLYVESIRRVLQGGSALHVVGPNNRVHEASVLLRAADDINRQRYHHIGVRNGNWAGTTPDHYMLDVALQLQEHAEEFIANRERFADFKDFDPKEYAERWYDSEEEPLVDDQDICRTVASVLRLLQMYVGKAVDIGCGPNAYPAMLSLPYAEHLDLLDYAPPNRDYMNAFLTGTAPQRQLQMWDKFVPYMVEGGGAIYEGITTHIRERAQRGDVTVQPCDVFNLQGTWELMSAYFLIESISTYPEDQHLALASMANSLDREGLMIVGSMLNQKGHVGYKAGVDKEYPNLSQTTAEMERAFLDNNLYPVIVRLGKDERKGRDGYDGMVLTFACHRGSERQQQLTSIIPELTRRGFDVVA